MKIKNTFFLWLCLCCISCLKSQQVTPTSISNEEEKPVTIDDVNTLNYANQNVTVGANRTSKYLPLLRNKNVALVANQTSVIYKTKTIKSSTLSSSEKHLKVYTEDFVHLVDSLLKLQINLKKVFAPEHGFRGTSDAGETVADGIDKKTKLPIISLYGKNKKPSRDQLKGLDVVIFDIQDVGVRFYTYISTLHYVMEACAENNLPLLILDRPNPNGFYIDGPTLEPENSSFLGMHPIPLVHGMTIGEYAKMINGEKWLANGITCDLTVITCLDYDRAHSYHLPIRPSPNLPNDKAINLYPSLGLFEGTNVNAGRGTEHQFQRFGAPFLDSYVYKFSYTPMSNKGAKDPKHNGILCHGKDLAETPFLKNIELRWLINAYNNSLDKDLFFNKRSFTLHSGTSKLQEQIEKGVDVQTIVDSWASGLERFKAIRARYLLYQ
ncbi:exo-beta-N-acetylmuramidase NamZ domain-containing protein [Flavobacteriaceae bacterium M23B6Z8]